MPAANVRCDTCKTGHIEAVTVRELYGKDYPVQNDRVKAVVVDTVFHCTGCGKIFGVTSTCLTERRN